MPKTKSAPEPAPPIDDFEQSGLAQALVKDGAITPAQLRRAQRIQKLLEEPQNCVRILVELGEVTEEQVASVVAHHGKALPIGELLLEQGFINGPMLREALERQKHDRVHLGQVLLEMGHLNERILLRNVARQRGVAFIEPSFAMVDTTLLHVASPDYMEKRKFVPFSREDDGRVTVVLNDLDDEDTLAAIKDLYQDNAALALGPADAIEQTIDDYRRYRERPGHRAERSAAGEDSIAEQVDHIIQEAISQRASDIHIEPMSDHVRLRYRIDGVLVYRTDLPKSLHNRIISRVKVMAEIDIADHLHHQGGRVLYTWRGIEYDLRISIYVTVYGQNIVIRILNKEMGLVSLQELGMAPVLQRQFKRQVLDVPSGVVLITAPTGEGKTTTLYSCLDYANEDSIKIITAEDPVEYMLEGVIQCAIHEKAGRSFESTLREIVRQDPDIVVLGEIRDKPTAQFAIEAALTGHKVYCTFHTEDSVAALLRLIDMGIEPFLISSTVRSVLAQRLLRRVCENCAAAYLPSMEELDSLGVDPIEARKFQFLRGAGCGDCNFTGYKGRVAVFECLIMNESVRAAVFNRQPASVLRDQAFATTGIVNLREDALAKAAQGVTSLAEVRRKTPIPHIVRPLEALLRLTGTQRTRSASK